MNGDRLSEHVPAADHQSRLLTLEFQILWDQADRGEREDLILVADFGPPIDDRGGADPTSLPDSNVLADHRVRPNDRSSADLSLRVHDGCPDQSGCRPARAP